MPHPSANHGRTTSSSTTLSKKRLSGNGRPVLIRKNPSSKSLGCKRESVEFSSRSEEEDMAASFHQFCATCEKQIVVPNASILYCSEECRRNDVAPCAPASPLKTWPDGRPQLNHDLMPPMSPTIIPKPLLFRPPTESSTPDINASRPTANEDSDLSLGTKRPPRNQSDSEAGTSESQQVHRPRGSRPTTATTTTPSLSFSPSSYASSLPYTPATKSSRSLGHSRLESTKSIDLVLPTAACPTAPASLERRLEDCLRLGDWQPTSQAKQLVLDDDAELPKTITYEKRAGTGGSGSASSSLKQLLNSERGKPEKAR